MNHIETIHSTLVGFPETTEETPFGPEVLVYKVAGKMFATFSPDDFPVRMNLKCDPERAIELRDEYEAILPGYHMNKRHWNTVVLTAACPIPWSSNSSNTPSTACSKDTALPSASGSNHPNTSP